MNELEQLVEEALGELKEVQDNIDNDLELVSITKVKDTIEKLRAKVKDL